MNTKLPSVGWLKSAETRAVMAALDAVKPGGSRFVGGCVRNTLLGAKIDDIDIATQLPPEAVIKAGKKAGLSAVPTGIEHGTITLIANHKPYEITTLRRDVSTDGRRATVSFTEDWNEDAARRDFRLNALYADLDGTIHDPTGGGLEDAKAGRIQFIGDAEQRIREDYLRILRFFRFAAWYGKQDLDPRGLAACAALKDGLKTLSAERVWKEIKKLLDADDPRTALHAMHSSGVLAAVLPEASNQMRFGALVEIETGQVFSHDAMTRLAALLPDNPAVARELARRLKVSNDERERLVNASSSSERIVSYMSMREVRRALYRMGRDAFVDRTRLAWADDPQLKTSPQWRALLALAQAWEKPKLQLTGEEIMQAGVPSGPKVGAVMREVEDWWIDSDFTDDKLSIVERLKAVAQGLS